MWMHISSCRILIKVLSSTWQIMGIMPIIKLHIYSEKDYAKKIEELKTVLSHKDEIIKYKNEIIEQKDRELKALQEIISLIKSQQKI